MNSSPLVSIIIPVYNGSNYLSEAIESALGQTYDNCEIIVVNDGSSDDGATERIALSYGDKIRYYAKENGGVATALNMGIELMKGDFFSWLSHDDLYYPDKVAAQVAALPDNHDKRVVVYSGYDVVNHAGNFLYSVTPAVNHEPFKLNIPLFALMRGLLHGCAMLIPRVFFEKYGTFDPALKTTQDYDLWFRFFNNNDVALKYVGRNLIKSRWHDEQSSKRISKHSEECSDLWIRMCDEISTKDMQRLDGSEKKFLANTKDFLENSADYHRAVRYLKERLKRLSAVSEENIQNTGVAVIIPFYNRVELLVKSIESVLNQDHQKFELVLVDDGSEEPLDLVGPYLTHPKVVYLRQEHKGVSAARNFGIAKAKYDYVAFLDSDDLFAPEKLSLQLRFMFEEGCCASCTHYGRINLAGEKMEDKAKPQPSMNFPGIISHCTIATPTVMYDKSRVQLNFDENLKVAEDICAWIRLSYDCGICLLQRDLTFVRVTDTTSALDPECQLNALMNIIRHVRANYDLEVVSGSLSLLVHNVFSIPVLTAVPCAPRSRKEAVKILLPAWAVKVLRRPYRLLRSITGSK